MVTRSSGGGGQCVLWTIWALPLLSLSLLSPLSTDCSFCLAPELVLRDKTFFFPLFFFSSGARCDISVWINFHWAFLRERPLVLHWKLWLFVRLPRSRSDKAATRRKWILPNCVWDGLPFSRHEGTERYNPIPNEMNKQKEYTQCHSLFTGLLHAITKWL